MFRFLFFVLLSFILILQIKYGLSQNNDESALCDCNCDVQINVVKKLLEDLDEVRKNTDKISDIEKQLAVNRVSKPSSYMEVKPPSYMATNPSSCMEAAANSLNSGVYKIKLEKLNITDFEVFCEQDIYFGGWLVIQRRQSGSVNFNRDWNDYKEGFGDLTGNYWIGLEKLHALTNSCEQELYVQLDRRSGEKRYAKYSLFLIGDESEDYILKSVGDYSGNAGDSLSPQSGYKFSTYDRDNDIWGGGSCAKLYEGGWWYHSCYRSHLNGLYGDDNAGVNWCGIREYESLTFVQMMIRPTANCWRRWR
ncbi:angiopoietin-related protein 1 [Zeugodacus cucurbitae]|uniref:angiopoietin-related protein 1 n=1 Tax=Zeugodacus cucurbitae TaxID=28588 RepID=UPI000596A15F|nr:angiopoietin-related protein 1 [Zeugodacus cucurbitae]